MQQIFISVPFLDGITTFSDLSHRFQSQQKSHGQVKQMQLMGGRYAN
ncbi:hypothetical protein [Nitrosomonas sp.]|nr:hypothetical protein [Nitrosomonas sp.]